MRVVHGVDEQHVIGAREETMREPGRDEEAIARMKLDTNMAAIAWLSAPQVDQDVKNPPARHAQELGLVMRRSLPVQPAQGALSGRFGQTDLHRRKGQAHLLQVGRAPQPREGTARVA